MRDPEIEDADLPPLAPVPSAGRQALDADINLARNALRQPGGNNLRAPDRIGKPCPVEVNGSAILIEEDYQAVDVLNRDAELVSQRKRVIALAVW